MPRSREDNREAANAAGRAIHSSVREVGPLPEVADWGRRDRCEAALLEFLGTYFPNTFNLEWSDDHLATVAEIERIIRGGGLLSLAMPRGTGKSMISIRAALWAVLYGLRRYVAVVAAESQLAKDLIEVLTTELQGNPLLLADFPEVCHPIQALQNETKRQKGQTVDGVNTRMRLAKERIVFPTVAAKSVKSEKQLKASGAMIRSVGITGSLRGMVVTGMDGTSFRPDLALVDDAQNRKSAKSPVQTTYRERLVKGDVLGWAGPGVKIACMNLCTVIYPDDLSDRLLDREKNPAWNGRRTRLLHTLPENLDLWDQYAEIRRRSQREHGDNRLGNAFYKKNRKAMDKGAVAGWPARFEPDEVSAVQFAMNLRIDRPDEFAAEYQNEPVVADLESVNDLTAGGLAKKLNRVKLGEVPRECSRLTAFIDVGRILWWGVCGWDERFGGSLIDYGTWPQQNRTYFTNADARQTIATTYSGLSEEAATYKALGDLVKRLAGKEWVQEETGVAMRLDRALIDSAWMTDTIYSFCRKSAHAGLLLPSRGYAVGPTGTPIDFWPLKDNERRGPNWRLAPPPGKSGRLLTFDPNHWKTFVSDRLLTPEGAAGCLWVNGKTGGEHEMLFDHLTCEFRVRVELEKKGRVYDAWAERPGRKDNHLWDILVGCAVAASERGLKWHADGTPGTKRAGEKKATPKKIPAPHERRQIQPKRLGV